MEQDNSEKQAGFDALMERPLGGATTFAELAEVEDAEQARMEVASLFAKYRVLADNIMCGDIENKGAAIRSLSDEFAAILDESGERHKGMIDRIKELVTKPPPTKTEGGVAYPAADYAYVPDPTKPSTWKLRLTESPGKVTTAQLGRAAAALSSGGFRGQRVQLPSEAVARVKRRIRAEYRKLGVAAGDMPDSVKGSSFKVWKDQDGRWRWLAIYSNKFRDRDNPPEILAEQAHKDFVSALDAGEWDMPELWLWHTPQLKSGVADFTAWDDRGFMIACGLFDKESEDVAERLALAEEVGVSHGMLTSEIERDTEDPTIITRYRSVEISPLPRKAAANELTGFVTFESEETMEMAKEKQNWLEQIAGAARLADLDQDIDDKATRAAELQLEHKEASLEEPVEETKDEEPATEPEPEPDQEPEPEFVSAEEGRALAQAIHDLAQVVQEMSKGLGEVKDMVSGLQESDEAKIAKQVEGTPAASILEILAGGVSPQSVIGQDEARVDGRTSLAKGGPKETEAGAKGPSMVPIINQMIAGWDQDMDINSILGLTGYQD